MGIEPGARCEVWSPCKLNPSLGILGKREDGMHEVQTTLLALDRCDRVRVELCELAPGEPPVSLTASGPACSPDIPLNASNLAWRGAQVALQLAQEGGLDVQHLGLRLQLEKHVPSQAGLGGGSSNAAAAAYAVAKLLGLSPDAPELLERLGSLGADVPFFLGARHTGWGLCRGRGERVEARELPPMDARVFVIWTPRLTCSTAAVYAALEPGELHAELQTEGFEDCLSLPLEAARRAFRNDLQAAALRSHAGLAKLLEALGELGPGVVGLCGSGSSCFGMFDSHATAVELLNETKARRIERDFGLRAQFIARARGAGVGE